MKANRRARHDVAGAETVGAIILFGIFVGVLAFLNVTAVPQAGLAGEEAHFLSTLSSMNALQSSAEAASLPGSVGTTVSQAVLLGPTQTAGSDFFSFFVATPAQASGELVYNASYGGVKVRHRETGTPGDIYDVGSATTSLPVGQIAFDPHPIFRNAGVVSVENGAIVTTDEGSQTLRYAPPITVTHSDGVAHVTLKTRLLNGTSASVGGSGPARLSLTTQATTLNAAPGPNAESVTLVLETAYGSAWGGYLNATSASAGLASGTAYATTVERGAGASGLDVVTWTVTGTGTGNDVRLTTGFSLLGVVMS